MSGSASCEARSVARDVHALVVRVGIAARHAVHVAAIAGGDARLDAGVHHAGNVGDAGAVGLALRVVGGDLLLAALVLGQVVHAVVVVGAEGLVRLLAVTDAVVVDVLGRRAQ